jgi:F0F1-type ATP synthase assembly protein I
LRLAKKGKEKRKKKKKENKEKKEQEKREGNADSLVLGSEFHQTSSGPRH